MKYIKSRHRFKLDVTDEVILETWLNPGVDNKNVSLGDTYIGLIFRFIGRQVGLGIAKNKMKNQLNNLRNIIEESIESKNQGNEKFLVKRLYQTVLNFYYTLQSIVKEDDSIYLSRTNMLSFNLSTKLFEGTKDEYNIEFKDGLVKFEPSLLVDIATSYINKIESIKSGEAENNKGEMVKAVEVPEAVKEACNGFIEKLTKFRNIGLEYSGKKSGSLFESIRILLEKDSINSEDLSKTIDFVFDNLIGLFSFKADDGKDLSQIADTVSRSAEAVKYFKPYWGQVKSLLKNIDSNMLASSAKYFPDKIGNKLNELATVIEQLKTWRTTDDLDYKGAIGKFRELYSKLPPVLEDLEEFLKQDQSKVEEREGEEAKNKIKNASDNMPKDVKEFLEEKTKSGDFIKVSWINKQGKIGYGYTTSKWKDVPGLVKNGKIDNEVFTDKLKEVSDSKKSDIKQWQKDNPQKEGESDSEYNDRLKEFVKNELTNWAIFPVTSEMNEAKVNSGGFAPSDGSIIMFGDMVTPESYLSGKQKEKSETSDSDSEDKDSEEDNGSDDFMKNLSELSKEEFPESKVNDYKEELKMSEEEAQEMMEDMKGNKGDSSFDKPMKIASIFNDAYRKYTKDKDEYDEIKKVSPRKSKRYEKAGDTYRDKKMFAYWNKGVLSLLGDYGDLLSKELIKFINAMLDNNNMFNNGAQFDLINDIYGIKRNEYDSIKSKRSGKSLKGKDTTKHSKEVTSDDRISFSNKTDKGNQVDIEINNDKVSRTSFIITDSKGKKYPIYVLGAKKGNFNKLYIKFNDEQDLEFIQNYTTKPMDDMGLKSKGSPVHYGVIETENKNIKPGREIRIKNVKNLYNEEEVSDKVIRIKDIAMLTGENDKLTYKFPSSTGKSKQSKWDKHIPSGDWTN